MLGLYVHVPFCRSICNYCNFNRRVFDAPLKAQYVEAVLREIRLAGRSEPAPGPEADTVYFGGGTPSLLEPGEIESIIGACRDAFALGPEAEVTLEVNPETVDAERLNAFRHAGVNRLSFGVQSFRDEELGRLDRRHSARRAEQAVAAARTVGFHNVSLDLMMWLPEQTVEQWMVSVDRALGVAPEHLSLYMLEVYPHLPLKMEMTRRNWNQLSDDTAAEMYEASMARFEAAGYEQYEISNLARPGWRSRHNLKYWSDGAWLGFGPGAHSTRADRRWKNVSSTDDYIERVMKGSPVVTDCCTQTNHERLGDALFTGLRLTEGIDIGLLSEQYRTDIWTRYGGRLAPYLDAQLLLKDGNRLRLTRQGMLLAHEVMAVFV